MSEAKAWLRVGHADEDGLIGDLLAAARERVEAETGRALIARSYREILDAWPQRRLSAFGQAVRVATGPLLSVEAIRTYGRTGAETVFDPAEYRVETGEPGRVIAVYPFALPCPDARGGRIEIDFTAGFGAGAEDVPAALREAVLRLVGEAYSNTEPAQSAARGEGGPPEAVEALLRPFRRVRL